MKAFIVTILTDVFIRLGKKIWETILKKYEESQHKKKVKKKVKEIMKEPDAQDRARRIDDILNS